MRGKPFGIVFQPRIVNEMGNVRAAAGPTLTKFTLSAK